MKKTILVLLVICSPCFALKEWYALKRSVRALGMGGAFYANSDDEYALFYNPAGLAEYRGSPELGVIDVTAQAAPQTLSALSTINNIKGSSTSDAATQLEQYQGVPLYGNVGADIPFLNFHMKNFGFAIFSDAKADLAVLGQGYATTVDVTAIEDAGLVVGYARKFLDDLLAVGINAKGIVRAGGKKTFTASDLAAGSKLDVSPSSLGGAGGGVDFDLGGTYEIPDLPFGVVNRASLSLNNLLASQMTIGRVDGAPPGLPRMVSLGWFTAFPGVSVIDNFNVLVDFAEFEIGGESDPDYGARTGSFFKHVNLGMEAPLLGVFAPRIGIHQGYWTVGLGINLRALKIDFATYQEELYSAPGRLPSRRLALHIALGLGSPPPAPYPATRPGYDAAPMKEEKKPSTEQIWNEPGEAEKKSAPKPEQPTTPPGEVKPQEPVTPPDEVKPKEPATPPQETKPEAPASGAKESPAQDSKEKTQSPPSEKDVPDSPGADE